MKKRLLYLISIAFLMAFSACNDKKESDPVITDPVKDSSTVNLDFRLVYGNGDFELNKVYDYSLGYQLKFEKLKLYISNVRFIKADNSVVNGPEIIFVEDTSSTFSKVTFKIPIGEYSKMEYSMGVPPDLNGANNPDFDAALYNNDHPLSLNTSMYWTWNAGYRFILIDGKVNQTPMADDDFETLLSIHTGKDYAFRNVEALHEFIAAKDQAIDIEMSIDIAGFLDNPADVIDLAVDNQSHGENAGLANRVSDNAMKSVVIKQ